MKNIRNTFWFTLIELIVASTIFMIIIWSVMIVFTSNINISKRSEINRVMQENIKNVVEIISEDIRNNWISWVSKDLLDSCNFTSSSSNQYKSGNKFCSSVNQYYIAYYDNISSSYLRWDETNCDEISENCFLYRKWDGPITNSQVSISDLSFYVSDNWKPKLTINMTIRPVLKWWITSRMVKENKIIFQTSFTEDTF